VRRSGLLAGDGHLGDLDGRAGDRTVELEVALMAAEESREYFDYMRLRGAEVYHFLTGAAEFLFATRSADFDFRGD
jgi:hypothetical protein